MVGEIEVKGIRGLLLHFKNVSKAVARAVDRGLSKCGDVAVREAIRNAPVSPTKEQYSRTLKRKRRTDRKNFFPGGLEKSIECETQGGVCRVFVRENSFAGKYAKKIHDEKGRTWRNRGPGTIAKGRRADDKFIERAIRDNEATFSRIMVDEFGKAIRRTK